MHNLLHKQDITTRGTFITPEMVDRETNDGSIISGTWKNMVETNNSALQSITASFNHTYSREAANIRMKFTEYFNEEGAVP